MSANPLPRVGDVVSGKYRIESRIGEGGMGIVLGAVDTTLNRAVAIKFLAPSRAANEAAAERFQREARAAASIQSDHVVHVYEVGALENGALYIVMEHLKGSDLAHVVAERGGLPVHEACDFVLQTCEALGEAHARGIVHRDLKPQNLFLTHRNDGSPCVKVLDFGISKTMESEEGAKKLTSTDMVMGTPLYMSPEQVRSLKSVDARADVWALGAILHELLAASPPFDGPTASALHAAIAMDPPTPLRSVRPDVPAGIEAAVARCLEKKPADRFQDVGALASALAPFASERERSSAGRIADVVRAATIITGMPPAPSGDAATLDVGMASTMHAGVKGATDGAWEQKPAPVATKSPRSGARAGVIAAALLLVGGGSLVALSAKLAPPAPPPAPLVATANPPAPEPAAAPTPIVSAEPPAMSAMPAPSVSVAQPWPSPAPRPSFMPPLPSAASSTASASEIPALAGRATYKERYEKGVADDQAFRTARDEGECARHRRNMMIPVATEADRRIWAEPARAYGCKGNLSTTCQLALCIDACRVLGEQTCVDNHLREREKREAQRRP